MLDNCLSATLFYPAIQLVYTSQRVLQIMEFSFNDFYQLDSKCQKVLRSVLKLSRSTSLSCINEQNLRSADKEALSNIILSLVDVAENSVQVLKSASATIEQLRSDQNSNQKSVIKLQNELIQKQDQLQSVQFDLNDNGQHVADKFETAVKSVVKENERRKQIVLFGVSEESSDLGSTVNDILKCACGPDKPSVKDFHRVGARKPGGSRPVKVYFNSQEDAQTTMKSAKSLKHSDKFGRVFIAPDRSPEERTQRRKLVQQLRDKRQREPEKHHYISRGEVCSTDHHSVNVNNCNATSVPGLNNLATQLRQMEESFSESLSRVDARIAKMKN